MATASDYAWAIETHALSLNFCLTFVRDLTPDEVITRLGGARPVSIVSVESALGASEAVREWVDENGAAHSSDLDYVAVTPLGHWAMIIEPNGFLCTEDAVVRTLSAAGEMVSFYFNENTTPRFSWAVGGREVVGFDPGYPLDRSGDDRTRLDPELTELGFALDAADEDYDEQFRQRTLALMERITGVRWDAALLRDAAFRCAAVGDGAAVRPWYPEVAEELAAYAEDPDEWLDDDFAQWGERGVTDPRIKALGAAGTRLFDHYPELATAIAYAPAELIDRMTRWAWERPLRLAGVLDEPWFAPIRDLVRRGEQVPPDRVRLVEERMDAYLRTTLPPWIRDDIGQRRNAARALVVRWDSDGPASDLCWMLARAQGAGAGTESEILAGLRRDFPELADVTIPPPPEPPAERAAARRRREARERQEEQWRKADLRRTWGGRIPTDERLLEPEVQSHTLGLVPHDRDLIDRIAEAGPQTQRAMAVWAAEYCRTHSSLTTQDWAEAAVTALEHGNPPPPWFTDFDTAYAHWRGVPKESVVHSATVSIGDRRDEPLRIDPAIIAIHSIVTARHDDPLIAAMDTIRNAVMLGDPPGVLSAFRAAFDLT
jgi:hypothetical protein